MNALHSVVQTGKFIVDRDAFVDVIDASCLLTTNVLIAIALVQSYKQFSGRAIECLTPDAVPFEGAEEYTEQYCFAEDTFYISMNSGIAGVETEERIAKSISYYQWVPFVLLFSAACFRLPCLFWKHFSNHSGIRIQQIIRLANDDNNVKTDFKDANVKHLCTHLQIALRFHRRLKERSIKPFKLFKILNLQYTAYHVSALYLLTKILYFATVTFQLWLINKFLETSEDELFGVGAITDLLGGKTWKQSGLFPRVTYCDFQVRVMGNLQNYTVQCVLLINIFNEKIFIILWFWYIFLLFFTMSSFFYWAFVIFCQKYNINYIIKHLEMAKEPFKVDKADTEEVKQFIRNYLKADGIFAIRMLGSQAGVIFGADLVKALWNSYNEIEIQRKSKSESDLTKVGVEELPKTPKQWKFPTFLLTKYEKEKLIPNFKKHETEKQQKIEESNFPSKEI